MKKMKAGGSCYKTGGVVTKMARGGDGCSQRGKTKGRII